MVEEVKAEEAQDINDKYVKPEPTLTVANQMKQEKTKKNANKNPKKNKHSCNDVDEV